MLVTAHIDRLIDSLNDLKSKMRDPKTQFDYNSPNNEIDFVPWFFSACLAAGITEVPPSMLKQACENKGIELTIRAGEWFRNFGFTRNRVAYGQRWYDITYRAYPNDPQRSL